MTRPTSLLNSMRSLIDLVLRENDQPVERPTLLYHGTTSHALSRILSTGGMASGSHWTSRPDIAQWFAKHKAREKGGRQVVIRKPFTAFDEGLFLPDLNLMDFPIPAHEADHEDRLNGLVEPSNPTWQESLRLFDAVIYNGDLEVDLSECVDVRGRPLL